MACWLLCNMQAEHWEWVYAETSSMIRTRAPHVAILVLRSVDTRLTLYCMMTLVVMLTDLLCKRVAECRTLALASDSSDNLLDLRITMRVAVLQGR